MLQLTQKLKTGQMQVLEVSVPALRQGQILVRNLYSLISAGTESSTVKAARKGYIGKAKERPQQVKQVIDNLMSQGPVQTYRAVMKKLDAYSPLGYSCVGEVIDIGPEVNFVKVGDLVACGAATACHAEIVAVPENLAVKIEGLRNLGIEELSQRGKRKQSADDADCADDKEGVSEKKEIQNRLDNHLQMAAYNTLGAIAMQGVRQADLHLGETCAVIGLGLLGQLSATLLRASGVKIVGIDIDRAMVDSAGQHSVDLALDRDSAGIESRILEYTNGIGCDAVIIAAASSSLDPINFAGSIARKKATIVIVGDVPTGFDREPHFYKKELTVKMSCSYGPGRYDSEYEEKGHDYPVGYVRWTEKRNMQAFQELIASGKIDIGYLTTHVFKLEDAPRAYDMIVEKSKPFVGILIEYDQDKEITKQSVQVRPPTSDLRPPTSVSIGFIGAGSYAQSYLLPNIPKGKDVVLKGVMTSTSTSSRSVADRFGFEFCTGNEDDVLKNDEINTIFIATRHDSHGYYVKKAFKAGKNVFVEKPLCLSIQELQVITELLEQRAKSKEQRILMVGYNRRFSPLTQIIKKKITTCPMSMIYRVNAGNIPSDSWVQDMEIGGGRILGEVCHFVDYLTFINGSLPVSVFATAMENANNHNDTLTVSLNYENGSVGSVQYFANGSKSLSKEYVEIYSHGVTAILNDFRELKIYGKGRPYRKKLVGQEKGQKNEVRLFLDAAKSGGESPISLAEIYSASEVCFAVLESIRTDKCIELAPFGRTFHNLLI